MRIAVPIRTVLKCPFFTSSYAEDVLIPKRFAISGSSVECVGGRFAEKVCNFLYTIDPLIRDTVEYRCWRDVA